MAERSNENALAIIDQQYKGFIDVADHWQFFRGLAEYTKTIQELVPAQPLIEMMEQQREMERQVLAVMDSGAMVELQKAAEQMTKIAETVAEQSAPIVKIVEDINGRLNGSILSSNPLHGLDRSIFDLARSLRESGFADAIKVYENPHPLRQNIYGNYTFSSTLEKVDEEEKRVERVAQIEPWGAWEQLPTVRRVVFEPQSVDTLLAQEMELIRKGEMSGDSELFFFKKSEFSDFARRVHTYLTTELRKTDGAPTALDFDVAQSTLYFTGASIRIKKRAQSDAHDLLATIFKQRDKLWNNDEVLDDWTIRKHEKVAKNKVYQAGKAVNRLIAEETKIRDFLDVSTKTVAITKKYLSS